jgi:NTE family protein
MKKISRFSILAFLLLSLAPGCGTVPAKSVPVRKVALVLGGGGARGFAHVGVIRELENAGVPIDLIVGVSVGSLIGALYADSKSSLDLEWKAFKISKDQIFDYNVFSLTNGLAKGEALQTYLDQTLKSRYLEDMKIPLAVVAADLNSGRQVVFTRGPVREAVRASTSLPGVFPPLALRDMLLVDGGLLGNLAPQVARGLGATVVIAVSLDKVRTPLSETPNTLTTVLESIDMMNEEVTRLQAPQVDVMIRPDVGGIGITDFTHKKELMEAGKAAAEQALPQIKALLGLDTAARH